MAQTDRDILTSKRPSPRGGLPSGRARSEPANAPDTPPFQSFAGVEASAPDVSDENLRAALANVSPKRALEVFRERATRLRRELATNWTRAGGGPLLGIAGARLVQAIKTLDRLAQLTEGTWSTAQRAELRLAINSMILAEAALNTSEPASGVDGSPRARATSVQNVVALCQALARD